MSDNPNDGWEFIDKDASFRIHNPQRINSLYFPLANSAGIFSSITPTLNGDVKIHHNAYLSPPVSVEDLHNSRSARNFWIWQKDSAPWSATGNSALQNARKFTNAEEESVLEAGFLWQKVTRMQSESGFQVQITNFIPASDDRVELMKISISNKSDKTIAFTPTAAIPLFGRSADNLRDHRHVTSLLHRTRCNEFGVLLTPILSFDERGHLPNHLTYAILGVKGNGEPPQGFFPIVGDYIGEGGSFEWPQAVVENLSPVFHDGMSVDGFESLGGIRFRPTNVGPGKETSYILILAVMEKDESKRLIREYGNEAAFDEWLARTQANWQTALRIPEVNTGNPRYDGWLKWVKLQPVLRRYFGNSFLPYHDYGRGGRGWRDLWQDIMALLIMDSADLSPLLLSNFAGVRMDGSNATIIGSKPGEFKADRNNIPRVWMDHGAWPLLTTAQYIHLSGELAFLLRLQTYFKDHLSARATRIDPAWSPDQGTELRTASRAVYRNTIFEHLLVQHLTTFYNVGDHNCIRLEGADWNDALDMAGQRGESVAFSSFYAGNLRTLSGWSLRLQETGIGQIEIAQELYPLLDTLSVQVDYSSIESKRSLLEAYFDRCRQNISGKMARIKMIDVASDLSKKADWLIQHLRKDEWLVDSQGFGWFNGYYDNQGRRVEGEFEKGVRMTLTGQVFALMFGVASDEQAREIIRSVDHYLFDARIGYRLNTDFGEAMPDLGRAFGFAFGHKENGAMFSHMAVMYANALYQRGFVSEGHKVLKGIFQSCQDFTLSRIYPGIPEYIDPRGRGMYTYLTGSASWYLYTLVSEVFGVKGIFGDLQIEPKLVQEEFSQSGEAHLSTRFADREIEVTYHNPSRLEHGMYRIDSAELDGDPLAFEDRKIIIPRKRLQTLKPNQLHRLEIGLGSKG